MQKINVPDVDRKENIVGIFTHPQNWKITSNSNDDDPEKLKKILKGSHIDDEQWTAKEKAIGELDELLNKNKSTINYDSPLKTIEQLIDTFKGIDWMRLLNGIFRDTNIDIKLYDLVQVQDQYLLQLSDVISNLTKE